MTPQELLQQAVTLHQAGRLSEAEPLYAQALELAPGNYPTLHLLGLMRLQQGRLAEALALMEQALKAQPGAPDTLANIAIVAIGLLGRHGRCASGRWTRWWQCARASSRAFSNRGRHQEQAQAAAKKH